MTNEEKCARLNAKVAILNATIAAMVAGNTQSPDNQPFTPDQFITIVEMSGCTMNEVDVLFTNS